MKKTSWFSIGTVSIVAFGTVVASAQSSSAATMSAATMEVSCQTNAPTPAVVLTIAKAEATRSTTLLNFLPKYFSPQDAVQNCENTAKNLQVLYAAEDGKYLATDQLNGQAVICAVERRGMSCNHDKAQVLFSLKPSENPAQALYDMLGDEFKSANPLDARTVGRIYTETRPFWLWWAL